MIVGYTGLAGEGKTLSMVNDAIPYLLSGKTVYSNTPFSIKISKRQKHKIYSKYLNMLRRGYKVKEPNIKDDRIYAIYLAGKDFEIALKTAIDCLFCVDEAGIYLSNYKWNKLDDDYVMKFAQTRKYGLDLFYTSQRLNHTVKRLRDLTNLLIQCKKLSVFGFTFFRSIYYDPEFNEIKVFNIEQEQRYILKRKYIWPWQTKKLYDSYNSNFIVDSSSLLDIQFDKQTISRTEVL
jgi:hypothetical protein